MRKSTWLLVAGIILSIHAGFGQSPTPVPLLKKSLIKVNFSALAVNSYTIQYELVVGKHQSIAFTLAASPNTPLPFRQTLLNDFGGNADAKRAIQTTAFTKYTGTFEYRFYTGHNAPQGFYIAPFARYMNMKLSQDYTFTPSDGILHTAHLNAQFDGFGAGVLFGYQWLLGPRWAIDWWIAGPFYGTNINADFFGTCNMSDLSAQDRANLKNNIESVKLPLYTTTATIGQNSIDAKLAGPYYGIRLMGICLVYRF